MKWLLVVGLFLSFSLAQADDPDAAYESQLHDIYIRFNSEKMDESQWRQLVGGRASEAYQIHEGDNLWNISRVLFGDGNYWPKIWSINSSVVNPHLVETGNSIRFILGDVSDAPAFTITENSDVVDEQAAEDIDPDVEIPPPTQEYKPVLRHLPPSLPDWQKGSELYTSGVSLERAVRQTFKDKSILVSRVMQGYPEVIGRVAEVEGAELVASDTDHLVVSSLPGKIQTGQRYVVIHSRGKLDASDTQLERLGLETVVEYQGLIEIQEPLVGIKKSSDKVLFRARVLNGILPVTVGSDLINPPFIYYDSTFEGPRSSLVAQLIGGDGLGDMHLFARNNLVYLNRGSNDGVTLGQILPVRSSPRMRKVSTVVAETVAPIGYIKIVDVEPRFATAYVLTQDADIRPGDLTGQGSFIPDPKPNYITRK
jgi:hypothetical protein